MNKSFLTGGDKGVEWMLAWWIDNYKKHNDTPVTFCDWGLTSSGRKFAEKHFDKVFDINTAPADLNGWWGKPLAMWQSPHEQTCWLDTDTEVRGDISGIFDWVKPNKLSMVVDRPWTKRHGPRFWYNSGVVAFQGKPHILQQWVKQVFENPVRGDQETLHFSVLKDPLSQQIYIEEMPNKYNWLRLQIDHDNQPADKALVIHWTGHKGKDRIREQMGK